MGVAHKYLHTPTHTHYHKKHTVAASGLLNEVNIKYYEYPFSDFQDVTCRQMHFCECAKNAVHTQTTSSIARNRLENQLCIQSI